MVRNCDTPEPEPDHEAALEATAIQQNSGEPFEAILRSKTGDGESDSLDFTINYNPSSVVREALEVQAPSVGKAHQRGRANGFKAAEHKYRVDYHCSVCGGTLTITHSNAKEAAARLMREAGWAHSSCLNRK